MIDIDAIRAANPMPDIASRIVPLHKAGREWVACCPFHADRSPSFTVYRASDGVWRAHCFGCGWHGDVLDLVQRAYRVPLSEAARRLGAGDVPRLALPTAPPAAPISTMGAARRVWHNAQPVGGTMAEAYLRQRGIEPPFPPALRFSRLPCDDLGPLPCLVLAVRDLAGEVCGIQRIWLAPDGKGKAQVGTPKRSLGQVKGGAIRLGEMGDGDTVTVCEGPEDGLSLLAMVGAPVWVAAGASFLPAMQFPPGVASVIVASDNDTAGRMAARTAAAEFSGRGLAVRIIYPLDGYKDFNAEAMGVRS